MTYLLRFYYPIICNDVVSDISPSFFFSSALTQIQITLRASRQHCTEHCRLYEITGEIPMISWEEDAFSCAAFATSLLYLIMQRQTYRWIGKFRRREAGGSSPVPRVGDFAPLCVPVSALTMAFPPCCLLLVLLESSSIFAFNREISRYPVRLIKKECGSRCFVEGRTIPLLPLPPTSFIKRNPYEIHRHFRPGREVKLDPRILEFN